MLDMPGDELPVEVLTELGRVTWAAIKLEDYTEYICSNIDPVSVLTDDRRQVSAKIKDAKKALATWPDADAALRDEATAWLERARVALERRNAALHATPVMGIAPDFTITGQMFLGEMPRKNRPYTQRPLTVESLAELRSVLENAAAGWADLGIATGTRRVRGGKS
jgi:hypothetical protein